MHTGLFGYVWMVGKGAGVMKSGDGGGASFDFSAVGSGVLWGLILILVGGLVQGVTSYRTPLSPGVEAVWALGWQAMGGILAGFLAGRRARGGGWLHGGLAGMGTALAVAGIMGVLTELPAMAALLKGLGGGAGLGALAGIAGVNSGAK